LNERAKELEKSTKELTDTEAKRIAVTQLMLALAALTLKKMQLENSVVSQSIQIRRQRLRLETLYLNTLRGGVSLADEYRLAQENLRESLLEAARVLKINVDKQADLSQLINTIVPQLRNYSDAVGSAKVVVDDASDSLSQYNSITSKIFETQLNLIELQQRFRTQLTPVRTEFDRISLQVETFNRTLDAMRTIFVEAGREFPSVFRPLEESEVTTERLRERIEELTRFLRFLPPDLQRVAQALITILTALFEPLAEAQRNLTENTRALERAQIEAAAATRGYLTPLERSRLAMLELSSLQEKYQSVVKKGWSVITEAGEIHADTVRQVIEEVQNEISTLEEAGDTTGQYSLKIKVLTEILKKLIEVYKELQQNEEAQTEARFRLLRSLAVWGSQFERMRDQLVERVLEIERRRVAKEYELDEKNAQDRLLLDQIMWRKRIELYRQLGEELVKNTTETLESQRQAYLFELSQMSREGAAFGDVMQKGFQVVQSGLVQGVIGAYGEAAKYLIQFKDMTTLTFVVLSKLVQDVVSQMSTTVVDAFLGMISGAKDWQIQLRQAIASIIRDILRLMTQMLILRALMKLFPGMFAPMGFGKGGVVPGYYPYKVGYFQRGGEVPGTGRGDRVPALLEPGEFVIRRPVVEKIGVEFFRWLNNLVPARPSSPPGFQAGGEVKNLLQTAGTPQVTVVTVFDERELDRYFGSKRFGKVIVERVGERIVKRIQ